MGQPAARVTPAAALDHFFDRCYQRRPVTATFTGVHAHDHELPDWSPAGLAGAVEEMRALRQELDAAGRVADNLVRVFPDDVDLALADAFLEIQIAEHEGPHFYRGNPALWTGEAIFSIVSLVTRDFAPIDERLTAAVARLRAIPAFLASAHRTLGDAPDAWTAKARQECEAAEILFGRSLPGWIPGSGASPAVARAAVAECATARSAFAAFAVWLRDTLPRADASRYSAPTPMLELLVRRGHWWPGSLSTLLEEALAALDDATVRLVEMGWPEAQAQIASRQASPEAYLSSFADTWTRAREAAVSRDLLTWPDAPIRFVPIPAHTREAAPLLYYLSYRSPAAFDRLPIHDYVVPPAANDSAITLNHVIHHGGIGHHVQNWNAYRSASRIGQVAAIDAASRIAMFSGGSLAEGWACYVCDLMEEIGFLSPLDRVAQQHTRVRLLARAVVDLSLHAGQMTLEAAARFYESRGMMPAAPARAEAVKNSMFPGAAVMYWLGARAIHDLCRTVAAREGKAFSLKRFHDRLLSYGAIPAPLIARLMS
ncbi:MAG: DUF885 family protein [Vicinamibacterales bacterium]